MRAPLALVLFCASSLAPPAGAQTCQVAAGGTAVCLYEETIDDGTREAQNGGSEFSATNLHAHSGAFAVTVFGAESCYDFGDFGSYTHGIFAFMNTPAGFLMAWWSYDEFYNEFGSGSFCTIAAYDDVLGTGFTFLDCPLPPPNPGWGHLLPPL